MNRTFVAAFGRPHNGMKLFCSGILFGNFFALLTCLRETNGDRLLATLATFAASSALRFALLAFDITSRALRIYSFLRLFGYGVCLQKIQKK